MSFDCPHCGRGIDVIKHKDVTSAQPISSEGDLARGIVKATTDAIQKKVSSPESAAISSLEQLNQIANGVMSESSAGLASGWGGSMLKALEDRERVYDSSADLSTGDPALMDRNAAADKIQSLIGSALSKPVE